MGVLSLGGQELNIIVRLPDRTSLYGIDTIQDGGLRGEPFAAGMINPRRVVLETARVELTI